MAFVCPVEPTVELDPKYECPLVTHDFLTIGGLVQFTAELLSLALTAYILFRQIMAWLDDVQNLQDLADCYYMEGFEYKKRRLEVRDKDDDVQGFQNGLPSYPGPCESRIRQARLNTLMSLSEQHKQAIMTIPGWAKGDKRKADYEAAKAEVTAGLHAIASSKNQEANLEDAYAQVQVAGLARGVGGQAPQLAGAFRAVTSIAEDNLRRSTTQVNDAFGVFGNVVTSLNNKYLSGQRPVGQRRVKSAQPDKLTDAQVQNIFIDRGDSDSDSDVLEIRSSSITAINDSTSLQE